MDEQILPASGDDDGGRGGFAHAPVHIVDTAAVAAGDAPAMLALIRRRMVPVMTEAGATLLSCLTTSPEIGEEVSVQTIWQVPDHASWNSIRKTLFLDPRWHAMWTEAARLRTGGNRRFYYPARMEAEA